jgi:hypothetical protein
MQKNGPDFIGIGASHAGLSVVTKLLAAHPGVADVIPALNFFNTENYTSKGSVWYESMLKKTASGTIIGECSPAYLTMPGVAKRMVTEYPDAKLFVVLRNPLDRAIAQYNQACRNRVISPQISCARYLATHQSIQTTGFYGQHLHEYFEYYTSLQIQVILYEDLLAEPLKTIQALYAFLELDHNFIPKALLPFAPPPDEPKHRGRISRLIHFVTALIKKARTKPLVPIVSQPHNPLDYFSPTELETFKRIFAVDSVHLTNLLHRDMGIVWNLVTGE